MGPRGSSVAVCTGRGVNRAMVVITHRTLHRQGRSNIPYVSVSRSIGVKAGPDLTVEGGRRALRAPTLADEADVLRAGLTATVRSHGMFHSSYTPQNRTLCVTVACPAYHLALAI